MPSSITVTSPAKLNLFLHIVGRRVDGYHNLETLFQFLDYGDRITIAANASGKIILQTPMPGVALEDNLIYKAATALQRYTKTQHGCNISIEKVLPMGGGLGGGSSNAATVLLLLNKLWQTNVTTEKLADIGLSLGADVPIFVHGFSAFAQGVGEKLTQVHPKEYWYLISKPDISISTAEVFTAEQLPRNSASININDYNDDNLFSDFHNDCQTYVVNHYPKVANLLARLLEYAPSRMTGTGACIFSCFSTKDEALAAAKQLPDDVECFVAKGVNNSPVTTALRSI
ncbi:4-(cytidine 5'-diphospho)-2-C-methyl-D-erythritol kinase [Thalassotalea agarivorans]|nr:4-(cytidine 5'-diphospho)-2-C-methyl-D-erythritol kinase [Thalassotalea agarivorans]